IRIKKALATIVRISKAAGAKRILLPTHPVLEVNLDSNTDETLRAFDRVLGDKSYFNFVTAHPQGGNMMASDSFDERVVDLDFRVRDCENLFVCDASIFPRGIRVNPQWTIMALASEPPGRIAQMTYPFTSRLRGGPCNVSVRSWGGCCFRFFSSAEERCPI